MLKRLTSLIRRILGEVQKNMVAILMGLIGIFLPIGAAFFILAFQNTTSTTSISYVILGTVFWGMGMYVWTELRKAYQFEEDKKDAQYLIQLKSLENIRADIKSSIDTLVNEIRLDREDRAKGVKRNGGL